MKKILIMLTAVLAICCATLQLWRRRSRSLLRAV